MERTEKRSVHELVSQIMEHDAISSLDRESQKEIWTAINYALKVARVQAINEAINAVGKLHII